MALLDWWRVLICQEFILLDKPKTTHIWVSGYFLNWVLKKKWYIMIYISILCNKTNIPRQQILSILPTPIQSNDFLYKKVNMTFPYESFFHIQLSWGCLSICKKRYKYKVGIGYYGLWDHNLWWYLNRFMYKQKSHIVKILFYKSCIQNCT